MTNNKTLYIIITVLVLAVVGGVLFFFLSNNKGVQKENEVGQPATTLPSTATQAPVADNTMVDCGQAKDPGCFMNRLNECLPVTTKMTGSDSTTAIEVTILGVENEKCHFQRKINNVIDLNCYFPKGTMNGDTFNQMFGNDKGLQKVVDDACKFPTGNAGW
jgi:hypothetical protein